MRLQRLELIRYGRFSDLALDFPRAERDFHLVVGANEAGKSTIRRAIPELLFGMPLRSEMAFVHDVADLRLGAVLESAAGRLALHRSHHRRSLRRPDDEVLPEAALAEHLGRTGEALYSRMFCLDLAALLEGGRTILDAADDVGQLLFQSAAGLSSLGAVRDALAEEAARLYAPRRAGDRAFYQALDRHEQARQQLRQATVVTKVWSAALARVEDTQAALHAAAERYRGLAGRRHQLERMRRIAPRVAQLRDAQAQLAGLAHAVSFAADAAQRLTEGEVTIATKSTTLALHRDRGVSLQAQLDALPHDDVVLAQATRVEALAALGHACSNHRRDIARCEQELQALWRDAAACAAQLGWPTDEAALRARLPAALALKTLSSLLHERGALEQARQSALDGCQRARSALQRLQQQQADPAAPAPSPELPAALHEAQSHRAGAARLRPIEAAIEKARLQLDTALSALSNWRMDAPALATLPLPTDEHLAACKAERAACVSALELARQQQAQAQERSRLSALALEQFAAGHHVVSSEQVLQARQARDGIWARIKSHQDPLDEAAPRLDQAIAEADHLVDSQRDRANESAQLAALRQDSERDAAAARARERQLLDARRALDEFDARWAAQAAAAGLPGMPLLDLSGWLQQRRAALDAWAQVVARTQELDAERGAQADAAARLRQALRSSGATVDDDVSLAALCGLAERLIAARQAAQAAAEQRARQTADTEADLEHQQQLLRSRTDAVDQWLARWQAALRSAAFDGAWVTPDTAVAAIDVAQRVLDLLGQIDQLRVHRVQAMQRDLAEFDEAAQALRQALGLADEGSDAFALAGTLAARLQCARELKNEHQRIDAERRASAAQARAAEASLAATRASLESLYTLAGSEDPAQVRACIAASDRRRALEDDAHRHRQAIVDAGDGLALDALLAECDALSPEAVKTELEDLDQRLAHEVDQRTRLASELAQAQADLDRVHGGSDAAVAEAMRLESLAQLGDAAERYITVATAARMLRWAIDRYRERKQGPLLERAGALFAQLTLGSFMGLVPDFEATPPRLIAVRGSGERVGVEGLSEGTRDQLFLALRLAALEMHIDGDRPLPFIADDLFVNFHDSRSRAGLAALGELSRRTQVIFLTHHEHLVDVARQCIGRDINVVELGP